MKKVFKWIGILVAVLMLLVVVFAFLPVIPLKTHANLEPEKVEELRASELDENLSFTTSDGLTLFVRQWLPDSTIAEKEKTAILIFHGVTAHSGPYEMTGRPFSARGYTTFGLDYRGHGLSDGPRGDYESREKWKKDLAESVAFVRSQGFEKVIILGHSLGVAAAIYCTQEVPDQIDGLILLSGGYRGKEGVREEPTLLQKLHILSNSVLRPGYPVVHYFREGMTGRNDPLFNFSYTLRFLTMVDRELLGLPQNIDVPVLVAVGDQDELFGLDAVKEVFDDVPSANKDFLVLEGAAHARFPEENWETIADWLDGNF
ncbi:alpha/beta hydrolase [Jiulongibacter sediminis]|jgi:alpha-beta hydrolase superfamily lysophospholipase|uniref:alpha/beta hydrolase n=1 Tax=Jiulongibacter sediminis TaxID=1605367 RepID=UPI0026F30230|nr:alpha/beta hydrolase [Jiulongibacter sediminis]